MSTPAYIVELSPGVYIRENLQNQRTTFRLEAKRFKRKSAARQAIFQARLIRKYDNPVIIDLNAPQTG